MEKHRTPKLTWRQKQLRDEKFWQKQAKEMKARESVHPGSRDVPSLTSYVPGKPIDPLAHLDYDDRQAYLAREEAAKRETAEKMKKVAPLYNKGGLQYVGDDPQLIKSVASGTNRRRS